MLDKDIRNIYYVSSLNPSRVSIIDGNSKNVIKEIEIGPRPQNIIIDENDNVYVASDRNNKVTIIKDLFNSVKILNIPNNGNIKVDIFSERIYASNTEEIGIYNLNTGKKINSIKGFIAADCLEVDRYGKKLFVLDMLQNMIKVYDTDKFNLINLYKNVGVAPVDFLLEEDGGYIYIADKGTKNKKYKSNISIIDIKTKRILQMPFQKGSVFTSLEYSGINLYAVNRGLKRIEVVDIHKKQVVSTITTTLPIIRRIRLSKDKKRLYVISSNIYGKNIIDIIDTNKNIIIDSLFLEENSSPYDIGTVAQKKLQLQETPFVLMNFENEVDADVDA